MTTNNPPDDYLSIATPENVAFQYEVAGIGSRFLAAIVDTLIILALQFVVFIPIGAFLNTAVGRSLIGDVAQAWLIALAGLIAFALFWCYYVFFELLWNGQSPGKRWIGLRVIKSDGTPISFLDSLVRNLVRLVD